MSPEVAIIGAGNLGAALAVFLRKRDFPVLLSGTFDHQGIIPEVEYHGNRIFEVDGRRGLGHEMRSTSVEVRTCTITDAVQANVIIVTVPVYAQENVVKTLCSHNLRSSMLIFIPGGIGAGLVRAAMKDENIPKMILGTASSPYASRVRGNARIAITRTKRVLEIAATKKTTIAMRNFVASLFPNPLIWYKDMASIFFSNINSVYHPPPMLVSRGKIQGPGPNPLFYEECMPAAEEQMKSLDSERCMLVEELGLQTETLLKYFQRWYMPSAKTVIDFVNRSRTYKGRRAPSMKHRYITEDVKFLLVLMRGIANKLGFATPNIDWHIKEASDALGEDLWRTGKTLESLNLGTASVEQIISWLNGEHAPAK